jgi:precorrin-6x reductase
VKYLIDEMMSEVVSRSLNPLAAPTGDEFLHILDIAEPGTQDEDIPALCRRHGIDVLITLNVKDFGARKHYYAALLDAGVSVIVARPAKQQPDAGQQVALLSLHFERITRTFDEAGAPLLMRVTHSAAVVRDLEELIAEVSGPP